MTMLYSFQRISGWLAVSAVAFALIAYIAPQQMGVILFKILLVTIGVTIGYIVDTELFKYVTRIDRVNHDVFGAARILARAIIILAVLIALSLGI